MRTELAWNEDRLYTLIFTCLIINIDQDTRGHIHVHVHVWAFVMDLHFHLPTTFLGSILSIKMVTACTRLSLHLLYMGSKVIMCTN